MNKKKWGIEVAKILDSHFPEPAIPLIHSDPYTLLIAVLLSAQCTDARVNSVTPQLFARASCPEDMVKLTVEQIAQIIRSCGLFQTKARAIHELSEILLSKYGGKVPASFEALEALPGVGHKTASVVMAQAFHCPAFPVDTHILRCARRWRLSNGISVIQTERDLKELFPKDKWILLHLQIIYFARAFCPAKGHNELLCPICSKLYHPRA